ncbi:MAG: hypothetical protein Q7R80_02515 [bacterium]|nr:hypothetical protein [bacterium]
MSECVNTNTVMAWRSQTRRMVRTCCWLGVSAFLLVLALRDLQVDRRLDVVARLDRATPYLSLLGPPVRVGLLADRVNVIGEPVYVNLRIPRWFRRATVELRYENPGQLPLRFGVRTHPVLWAFEFPEPESLPLALPLPVGGGEKEKVFPPVPPGGGVRGGGGIVTMRIPFELQRSWQVERNVYRFVLSAPGANVEQPIVIHGLRVTAERDPICFSRLCL